MQRMRKFHVVVSCMEEVQVCCFDHWNFCDGTVFTLVVVFAYLYIVMGSWLRDRDGGNESVDDSDCGNVVQENDDDNDEDDVNDRNFRVGSFGPG